MSSSATVIVTLIAYNLILLGMGLWARRRTRDQGDFLLGGRRIGAWLTSLSASASTASAWTLLGISGFAYALGPPGLWLALGAVSGYVLNWCWVAPRLNRAAERTGALTLTELLLGGGDAWARLARRAASIIILVCFTFYVASQFQAAANAFGESLGISVRSGILLGSGVILAYTLLGGFLAVSLTDSLQGLLMLLVSLLLAGTMMFAIIVISGTNNIFSVTGEPFSLAPPQAGLAAAGFLIGSLCVGLGQPGQPHVANRFMAARDQRLLTGAAAVSRDWSLERARKAAGLKTTYAAVIAMTTGAALIALFAPQSVFLRVLFAWHALGASFAPLVYMAVLGRQVKSAYALAVLVLGFALTVILHWQPDTPGDWAERLVPMLVTLAIAIAGSRRMAAARE